MPRSKNVFLRARKLFIGSPIDSRCNLNSLKIVLIVTSSLLVFFFAFPILILFKIGTTQVLSAFAVPSFVDSVGITFLIATIAALISVTLGTPLGYILVRYDFKFKEVVDAFLDIPIMIPHIVVGIMIVLAFSSSYGVNGGIINTVLGATLAVTYVSATYSIRMVQTSVSMIDPNVELTARTLGASPTTTFIRVVFPQIRKAVASGALLAWARAIAETGALLIVAYYVSFDGHLLSPASIYIYNSFIGSGLTAAVKFSAAMVLVSLAVFVAYRFAMRGVHSTGK